MKYFVITLLILIGQNALSTFSGQSYLTSDQKELNNAGIILALEGSISAENWYTLNSDIVYGIYERCEEQLQQNFRDKIISIDSNDLANSYQETVRVSVTQICRFTEE